MRQTCGWGWSSSVGTGMSRRWTLFGLPGNTATAFIETSTRRGVEFPEFAPTSVRVRKPPDFRILARNRRAYHVPAILPGELPGPHDTCSGPRRRARGGYGKKIG